MRMQQRGQTKIEVAPRLTRTDALGGVTELFSDERRSLCGAVVPTSSGYRSHETGLLEEQTCCLLIGGRAELEPGDGVCIDSDAPTWRVYAVEHWRYHTAAKLERIGGVRAP